MKPSNVYERVFKNAATTLIGVIVLAFCGYVVIQAMNNGETVQEAATGVSGWITTGLLFIRSKNSLIGIKEKQDGGNANDNGNS